MSHQHERRATTARTRRGSARYDEGQDAEEARMPWVLHRAPYSPSSVSLVQRVARPIPSSDYQDRRGIAPAIEDLIPPLPPRDARSPASHPCQPSLPPPPPQRLRRRLRPPHLARALSRSTAHSSPQARGIVNADRRHLGPCKAISALRAFRVTSVLESCSSSRGRGGGRRV
ncbi:hypothetical protein C8J57DRAFT_1509288 [Mycena rebaudengoi]|nr:hypothetical protein C8J57DRAFT_1509288 [Mycena rebaudengoi]